MLVPVLAVTGTALIGAWFLLIALVGRSTFPARERVPLRAWQVADVRANARRGATCLTEVEQARRGRCG